MTSKTFSQQLEHWLKSKGPKTFGDLEEVFSEKSFAVAFLLLMSASALPLPTGGITNLLELITVVLAVEMIFGRTSIWVPKFLLKKNIGESLEKKALPKFIKIIRWFERFSRQRLADLLNNSLITRLIGVVILIFTIGALFAVPFSGLDTLPSLGVVMIALSLILDDIVLLVGGIGVGTVGIILEITLGRAALNLLPF